MAPKSAKHSLDGVKPLVAPPGPVEPGTTPVEAILSPRQNEIFEYIKKYILDFGFPPTVREMAAHFGVVVASIQDHLETLKERGVIRHHPGKARAIVVCDGVKIHVAVPARGGAR